MSSIHEAMQAASWPLGRYQVLSKVFRKELRVEAILVTVVRKKMARVYPARNRVLGRASVASSPFLSPNNVAAIFQ